MKKLLLLFLALVGMVGTVGAWTTVKLLNSVEGVWSDAATTVMTDVGDGSHNYFYYILDSSTVTDPEGNYYFRIYVSDDGKYYGSWQNDFDIFEYQNYGGVEGTYSFKLVTDKHSKYIISVGYFDNSGVKWNFTATRYSGTGTIFFNNTNNFSEPYAYVYCQGDARLTGGWPGTKMTANGDGTYSLDNVNIGRLSKVIISDNGNNQITDQSFSTDLVMDGNGTVSSLPVTIGSLGYATFSSIYPVNFSNVTDFAAYRAEQTVNNEAKLVKVTGKVAANTGLVLKGTGEITIPTAVAGASFDYSENHLRATVKETTIRIASMGGDYCYFLSGTSPEDVGFYYLSPESNNSYTDYTSGAGKAYYYTNISLANTGAARAAWIIEGEDTQGVNTVENHRNADVIYDLQGRVAKTAKAGLYIKNGKKVFVK